MLLPFLILVPFIGGLLCWQCERFNMNISRWISLSAMVTLVFLIFFIWIQKEYGYIVESHHSLWYLKYMIPWIPRLGITIYLALDGLSIIMIMLTGFLGILAILCSWEEVKHCVGLFYFNLLWVVGSIIGVFLAMDMFLFFFLWEMMLIPMYFLVTLWGNQFSDVKIRIFAATKFFIYTQLSSLCMLLAILGLVFIHYKTTHILTFNYEDLLCTPMSGLIEYLLMLGFFVAFAVKMPIVPLHGWLPTLQSQSSNDGSIDLVGIITKISAYGILRFILPLFPNASHQFSHIAIYLGIVGMFYAAWISFSKYDIKRIISYINISYSSFILIAIYSYNPLSYHGVIIQLISHSLSTSGILIICGQLYKYLNTRNIFDISGLWKQLNIIPSFFIFFILSMIGAPGTGNFIGEVMILIGNFSTMPIITTISILGLVCTIISLLHMIYRIYYGVPKIPVLFLNIVFREKFVLFSLVILLLLFGLYPQCIFNIFFSNMEHIKI